ncbi:hypothetical protein [Pseudomonas sp. GM49]|uniref:hypothetical protein n=1 Tax=Pseudomonas sp. GM49 TaxID=1144331 RepID=UPI000519728B|nr:hypothetical protein [Pseudomonas sp. GM49]
MRRLRWQAIEHLTSGHKLIGGLALAAGIFIVSAHFSFDESDRLLPQGIANIDLFAIETCRAESEPDQKSASRHALATTPGACLGQQTSHELQDEMESAKAYCRQFEYQGGAQWMPHSF